MAGLLVLTAPLGPEAVAWCSGVFDLLATALLLTCVLIARRYEDGPSTATRIVFVAVGIAALMSKETAAIGPGLVLLDAWAQKAMSRRLLTDAGILVGIVSVFSMVRLVSAFGITSPPMSKYLVQRAVFGSFGSLTVPWHIDVIHSSPWLPISGVLIVVGLVTVFFVQPGPRQRARIPIMAAAWILVSIVPVGAILFVAPDLQGSRYLYLSAVGWASLVVALAASERAGRFCVKSLPAVAVMGFVALQVCGTLLRLRPWKEAAELRDCVERAARSSERIKACRTVTLHNLPDSVRGAYVFRNGAPDASARDLGLRVSVAAERGPCSFQWSDSRLAFVPWGN